MAQGDISLINSEKGSWIILSTTSKSICMKDDLLTFFPALSTSSKLCSSSIIQACTTCKLDAIVYQRLFPPRNIDIAKEKINL